MEKSTLCTLVKMLKIMDDPLLSTSAMTIIISSSTLKAQDILPGHIKGTTVKFKRLQKLN